MAREDSSRRRADGRGRVVTGPLSNAATDDQSPQRCIQFFDCPYQIEFALVDATMAGAAVRLPTKSPRVGGKGSEKRFFAPSWFKEKVVDRRLLALV